MKKTFTANLNGTVFHIEEDAYDQLQRYLANIRAKFSGSGEAEEIMADIEARIAELFHERLQGRQAVSMADVDHVKQVMGQPEDYVDTDPDETAGRSSHGYSDTQRKHKRLFRDMDDRWIGGVISGAANYFGVEPLWLRIAAIVLLVAGWGSPVLIYFILWAFVPAANTAADRLEMRGEPVTVDNIKRVFEEGAERVKAGGERVAQEAREFGRQWGPRSRSAAPRVADVLSKLVGLFLVFLGLGLLLVLIAGMVGGSASLWQATWSSDQIGVLDLGGYVFNSTTQALWTGIGLFLLLALPVAGMFLAGFRLLLGTPAPKWIGWTISLVWLAALMLVVASAFDLANDFRRNTTVRTEAPLTQPTGNTLYLDMLSPGDSALSGWGMNYRHGRMHMDLKGIHVENGTISGAWGELDVHPSADSLFHLVVLRQARASSVKAATSRAERIGYDYRQNEDVLQLSPVVRFSTEDKVRVQEVRFIVQVPLGKSVFFREASRPMLDDIDNTTNTYDGDMVGHTWTMTSRGLEDPEHPADGKHAPEAPPEPATPVPTPPAVIGTSISAPRLDPPLPDLFRLLTSAIRA